MNVYLLHIFLVMLDYCSGSTLVHVFPAVLFEHLFTNLREFFCLEEKKACILDG